MNTTESLAMLLREGNAGANTVADHLRVLTEALAQIPHASSAKILVRVDGAGATHDLLTHLESLDTTRRTVRYTVGWKIGDADEQTIAQLPETAWETFLHQDGTIQDGYAVAELTALNTREGWPEGMRLIVRRVRPSRRQMKNLTAFEIKTGWRYSITAANIPHMWGISGSQHAQWLDVLHRSHAVVQDRVRCDKARGLRNLPSQSRTVNRGWMLAANLAADVETWTPAAGTARCGRPRRRRTRHPALQTSASARPPGPPRPPTGPEDPRHWLWRTAFTICWQRRSELPAVTSRPVPSRRRPERRRTAHPRARGTRRSRSDTRRTRLTPEGTNGANRPPQEAAITADESRLTP